MLHDQPLLKWSPTGKVTSKVRPDMRENGKSGPVYLSLYISGTPPPPKKKLNPILALLVAQDFRPDRESTTDKRHD